MPVHAPNSMEFVHLTRKHSLAVGQLVGHSIIKSVVLMKTAVVIVLDSVVKVNAVVENGSILPLATPARTVVWRDSGKKIEFNRCVMEDRRRKVEFSRAVR